jgi:hypothetical protein
MREDAERANKMGRKNMLLGSLLKDIPKAITDMAMAGTVYNAQNAVAPYNAAQYGRHVFHLKLFACKIVKTDREKL